METYRLSSRLREGEREYLIQTSNDAAQGSVATAVFVDGVQTEIVNCPHPTEITQDQMLSLVKLTHGEKKKELETLLKAHGQALDKDDPELMFHLATAFFYRRFYREAAELFARVAEQTPDHHQAHNYLGMTYLSLGDIAAAVASATHAVEYRPGFADYRNNLGEAYLAAGDTVPAIGEFEQAISINMYYGDAYFNLALAHLLEASRPASAARAKQLVVRVRECLNKASMIYPDYKQRSDYENGLRALEAGDLARALAQFHSVRETKKERHRQEFAAYYMRFVLYPEWVTERAVSDRIVYLEQELKRNPNYTDLQMELAQCYLEKARLTWKKALKQYERVMETHPGTDRISETTEEVAELQQRMGSLISRLVSRR